MSVRDYLIRRVLFTIVTLIAISMVSFVMIDLPPGDALDTLVLSLEQSGSDASLAQLQALKEEFWLDRPLYERYGHWMFQILAHGDFGRTMTLVYTPTTVNKLLIERVPMTAMLTFMGLLVSYLISMPLGIYCAIKQYSIPDFAITAMAFVGMAVPGFLIALVLLWSMYLLTGRVEVGFFSAPYALAPWDWNKVVDLLHHLPIPLLIVGIGGTGGSIRVMRAILLDELRKPYVVTARAKGVPEGRLLFKYPIRVACNPIVSGIGGVLPAMVSGGTIVEIVLNLPTMGPLLFNALMTQDMYVAGSVLMIISILTVIGVMLSDMLLAVVDPRIRFER